MEKVIELLNDNTVCYIATCSENVPRVTPRAAPMEYGRAVFVRNKENL